MEFYYLRDYGQYRIAKVKILMHEGGLIYVEETDLTNGITISGTMSKFYTSENYYKEELKFKSLEEAQEKRKELLKQVFNQITFNKNYEKFITRVVDLIFDEYPEELKERIRHFIETGFKCEYCKNFVYDNNQEKIGFCERHKESVRTYYTCDDFER